MCVRDAIRKFNIKRNALQIRSNHNNFRSNIYYFGSTNESKRRKYNFVIKAMALKSNFNVLINGSFDVVKIDFGSTEILYTKQWHSFFFSFNTRYYHTKRHIFEGYLCAILKLWTNWSYTQTHTVSIKIGWLFKIFLPQQKMVKMHFRPRPVNWFDF